MPLLSFEAARIADGGRVLLDGFDCEIAEGPAALIGDWAPLFGLLSGEARLACGHAQLSGEDPTVAVRAGHAGISRSDTRLPPRWKVTDYLLQSARLLGMGRSEAQRESRDALEVLGLGSLAKKALGALAPVERRAFLVAHATLGRPPVLALESPLASLSEPAREWLGEVLRRAVDARTWLVSFPSSPDAGAERELCGRAKTAVVLCLGKVVAIGPPEDVLGPGRRYLLRVGGDPDAFVELMRQARLEVRPVGVPRAPRVSGISTFTLDLPSEVALEEELGRLIEAAAAHEIPLFHLAPLGEPSASRARDPRQRP